MEETKVVARKTSQRWTAGLGRQLVLLWLAGVMLRLTILALPPVIEPVVSEFHLRGFDIGVLTALPSLFFATAAIPGAILISRYGPLPSLVFGLLLNALGAGARGFSGGVAGLAATTSLMCLGVAIMQPAMPTLVRTWTPARIGLATATYTCGLLCGEVLPSLWPFTPHLPLVGDGWRSALAQWALPVLATAAVIVLLRPHGSSDKGVRASRIWPDWREGSIWRVGVLLGAVNASYFGLNGFLPGWLARSGGADVVRSSLLALNAAQIPASLLLMIVLEKLVFRRWSYVVAGLLVLAASVSLATAPVAFAITSAAVAGFALAWLLTLALALPPLLVAGEDVPSVSAAVFTVSYTIAVLTALSTGALESAGAGRFTTVLPIAASALTVVAVGLTVRRRPVQQSPADVAEANRVASC